MTPCEDVQTIHASQNDNEAREWGFELHNNGDVIDSSEISDQLVFKAYKGGTEEILPTNGSVPTTSPIIADIKYPQGELTDQEFLYRESPTEEDGLAKIQTIYGNTLKWNQLIDAGADSTVERNGITFTVKSTGEVIVNGTATADAVLNVGTTTKAANHKIFIKGCPSGGSLTTYRLKDGYGNQNDFGNGVIDQSTSTNITAQIRIASGYTATNLTFIPQFFDLTMLGIDNLTLDEVKQWFADYYPLPYYQYDSGSLLPFRGEGLKTVGFNQFNKETATDDKRVNNTGVVVDRLGQSVSDYIKVISGQRYYLNHVLGGTAYYTTASYDANKTFVSNLNVRGGEDASGEITIPENIHYIRVNMRTDLKDSVCVNIINAELNGTYKPYTSSTLSLPIEEHFPDGMNGFGGVYDELRNDGTSLRIGSVDLGSLAWFYETGETWGNTFRARADYIKFQGQLLCPRYQGYVGALTNMPDMSISATNSQAYMFLRVKDSNYTDATAFKTAMNGIPLYFELATPTETSFTTASLVTENAEIPLSNEDGVLVGKCTEQLSENPGFIDAKIKLSDSDGECYSNKIQLHVERSPQ